MSDEATPQDSAAMSPASAGSVAHTLASAIFLASLALNALSLWFWLQNVSHPTVPPAVIRQGVGIAYCSPANANTEVDFALVDAVVSEVEREANTWLRRWWR